MNMLKNITRKNIVIAITAILLSVISYKMGTLNSIVKDNSHTTSRQVEKKETRWTCSMHPQINLPEKGKCPICFMDLIPLTAGHEDEGEVRSLTLSENARKLAGIVTAPAVRRGAHTSIRLTGKIAIDETKSEMIAARVSGRIDRLFVDYTGIPVKRGDHLARIYSPELITLQRELLEASRSLSSVKTGNSDGYILKSAERTFNAAKEKVRLLGFSSAEVTRILSNTKVEDQMTIRAGQKGIVLKKMIEEGTYVKTGMPLFHIVDLSELWVKLDAYETDLAWLRLGQKVSFSVEAWPGESFVGKISFIDPVVDSKTRTIKLRVIVENKDGKLKPDMFVKAAIKIDVSKNGNVVNNSLKGKWISPMHPQVVKDKPGYCDICGMTLVKAEELGYITSGYEDVDPLLIPATAPLFTGERAIVYVEKEKDGKKIYEGRDVVLGPAIENSYIVKSGIAEGEKVVVNGAFKIDGELQIRAKPSMMSPEQKISKDKMNNAGLGKMKMDMDLKSMNHSNMVKSMTVTKDDRRVLTNIYDGYFQLQEALASDNMENALNEFIEINKLIGKLKVKDTNFSKISSELIHLEHMKSIEDLRTLFEKLSKEMIDVEKMYGHEKGNDHYLAFCPMAFNNKGAYWLQKEDGIKNPFYGKKMLKCGEIKETYKRVWDK